MFTTAGIRSEDIKLENFTKLNIVVCGDVMLDQYIWGKVERTSPEAPVPVVKIENRTRRLGGTANVAANLVGLGCKVNLIGVSGTDAAGDVLASLMKEANIGDACIRLQGHPTTTKIRVIGSSQQLVRIDEEGGDGFDDKVYSDMLDRFKSLLPYSDIVILSDYGKGVFKTDLARKCIEYCRKVGVAIFVDPKMDSWERYREATCVTPNLKEFKRVAQVAGLENESFSGAGKKMREMFALKYLLVTRGADGMSLFDGTDEMLSISTQAREVFDVSGAGDTVIATVAAAFSSGFSMPIAMKLANLAAGIVVGKIGTYPVTFKELIQALRFDAFDLKNKVRSGHDALFTAEKWRGDGGRIVFTNGCFDLLHAGHVKLLQAAAKEGTKLIVGLNSDASVRRLKGPDRPILPQEDRATILAALDCVDMVVFYDEDTPLDLITALRPNVLVKGADYRPDQVVGREFIERRGGKVVLIPLLEGISITNMIERIHSHQLEDQDSNTASINSSG
ncbi:MAG: D-glycero-beta-D-manno-heptose-7-phosphate kinase [Planctomycetota bacterium]|jgi:D-beta-D-heptose 7-phosphate kinase/D-beta-D-heptose 1-phosphate adenosyltransferase